jgi:signal transduction histidine kinase
MGGDTMSQLTSQQLSMLAGRLQDRGERQNSDLARLLHDQLGGLLTAAKMDVSWLQGRLSQSAEPDVRQKLVQLEAALATAMNLKRGVVEQLRPALLEHFGLAMALQTAFEESCRRAGLQLDASVQEDLPRLPVAFAIALYRVAEGCLANILAHAQATRVTLALHADGAQLRLAIADDGIGMDLQDPRIAAAPTLCGMRLRMARLGGRFEIASTPGKGSRVEVVVPLPTPE